MVQLVGMDLGHHLFAPLGFKLPSGHARIKVPPRPPADIIIMICGGGSADSSAQGSFWRKLCQADVTDNHLRSKKYDLDEKDIIIPIITSRAVSVDVVGSNRPLHWATPSPHGNAHDRWSEHP